jgi:hypothetical protein
MENLTLKFSMDRVAPIVGFRGGIGGVWLFRGVIKGGGDVIFR